MFWLECGQARVNGRGKGRYDVTQGRETVLTRVENSNAGHGNARPGGKWRSHEMT